METVTQNCYAFLPWMVILFSPASSYPWGVPARLEATSHPRVFPASFPCHLKTTTTGPSRGTSLDRHFPRVFPGRRCPVSIGRAKFPRPTRRSRLQHLLFDSLRWPALAAFLKQRRVAAQGMSRVLALASKRTLRYRRENKTRHNYQRKQAYQLSIKKAGIQLHCTVKF